MALKFLTFWLPTGTPGTGKVLTSDSSGVGTWQAPVGNVFVQNATPVPSTSEYLWIQTGLGVSGEDFMFLIEDGDA